MPITAKESLHDLVDELSEEQAGFAQLLLEDLRNAADTGGEPLGEEALASLDRGMADVSAGRVTSLEEYERKRGL
jgi:hypothetical protein